MKSLVRSRIFWMQVLVILGVLVQVASASVQAGQLVVTQEQLALIGSAIMTIYLRIRTTQPVRVPGL